MEQDEPSMFSAASPEDLSPLTTHLALLSVKHPLMLFFGEMGAGKTTLIRHLGKKLGVEDHMGSPTFSIVNEYLGIKNPIYHFDLYRIEDEEELDAIGFREYLASGYLCLVEWPELAPSLLNEPHVRIDIRPENDLRNMIVTIKA